MGDTNLLPIDVSSRIMQDIGQATGMADDCAQAVELGNKLCEHVAGLLTKEFNDGREFERRKIKDKIADVIDGLEQIKKLLPGAKPNDHDISWLVKKMISVLEAVNE